MSLQRPLRGYGPCRFSRGEVPDVQPASYERFRLSSAVAKAIQEVHRAKSERGQAVAEKQDSTRCDIALENARDYKRMAALDQHRKEPLLIL